MKPRQFSTIFGLSIALGLAVVSVNGTAGTSPMLASDMQAATVQAQAGLMVAQARRPASPPPRTQQTIDHDTALTRLPDGAFFEDTRFTAAQLRALAEADIRTAGDLVNATPAAVGRLLDIPAASAWRMQGRLQEHLDRSPARPVANLPDHELGMNSPLRRIPGDMFLDPRLNNVEIGILNRNGIGTVRDLLNAQPFSIGRLIDRSHHSVYLGQERLRQHILDNRRPVNPTRPALTPQTTLANLPEGSFLPSGRMSRNQISSFHRIGVTNAGDLAEANLQRVAQIMRFSTDEARAAQGRLQKALHD